MQNHLLHRTGKPPLSIYADLLDVRTTQEPYSKRWHTLRLYQGSVGCFTAHIGYHSSRKDEMEYWTAETYANAPSLAVGLANYNPTAHVIGFPPRPEYAERQRQALLDLRLRYERMVSEILSKPEFVEVA